MKAIGLLERAWECCSFRAAAGLSAGERWLGRSEAGGGPVARTLWGSWAVIAVAIFAAICATGCVPMWAALNDYVVLLDGAWRMHHGQVPHQDFYSVLGALPLACLRIAFVVFGPSPDSLPKGMALWGVLFSAGALWMAVRRLPGWWPLLFATVVLACAAAPVPLGVGGGPLFGFRQQTTYAMFYNRLGWAALLPVMLAVCLPRSGKLANRSEAVEAAILGLCLVCAAFTKLNFTLACTGLLVWSVWSHGSSKKYWTGLASGAAAALLVFQVILGNVAGYLSDNFAMVQVERGESLLDHLWIRIQANRYALMAIGFATTWVWSHRRNCSSEAEVRKSLDGLCVAAVAALGLSLFVASFNWERSELPGAVVCAFILVELARRRWPLSGAEILVTRLALARIVALWLATTYLTFDLGAVAYGAVWKQKNAPWAARCEQVQGRFFEAMPVPIRFDEIAENAQVNKAIRERPTVDFPAVMMTSLQFTRWINDGADLLRPHVTQTDRIFVADWFNPYNLIFQLPPASGGALLWDYKRMLDERHHPNVQQTVHELSLIMVPKIAHLPAQSRFMVKTYVEQWVTPEHKVGESEFWTLYRVTLPSAGSN